MSVVHPLMLEQGWTFESDDHGAAGDRLHGSDFMHQVYTRSQPDATGRVTVPVLWDMKTDSIVSNESSEIIRMFNSAFDDLTGNSDDYWPADMRDAIEEVNADIYANINNGVYRSGFATSVEPMRMRLPNCSTRSTGWKRLSTRRYLMGDRMTEADWRFFTTLIRFDAVYVGHFKCNIRRIDDYPALSGYMRELYQMPGIAETVVMPHIKDHYYASHRTINPTGIVPVGPDLDFDAPHGRDAL